MERTEQLIKENEATKSAASTGGHQVEMMRREVNELLVSLTLCIQNPFEENILPHIHFFYSADFICIFSQTAAQMCFKFCVDVPWVDPYIVCYNRGPLWR